MRGFGMESGFEMDVRQFLARRPFGYRDVPDGAMGLFCSALTHDSFSNEALDMDPPHHVESYERLEFLGDAVLEFLACEHVYLETDLAEGGMTDYKQDKVSNTRLSERVVGYGMDIDGLMRVGGGRRVHRRIEDSMRADCFEALLAAVYLYRGMDECRRIVGEVVLGGENRPIGGGVS